MRKRYAITFTLCLCGALATTARAASIVYDNGEPGPSPQHLLSDASYPIADDFVLSSGETTFSQIIWWGSYLNTPPAVDPLAVSIYLNDAGVPQIGGEVLNALPLTNVARIDTGETVPGLGSRPIFRFEADIAPLTLSASQTYWLSLFDTDGSDHLWAVTDGVSGQQRAYYDRSSNPNQWRSTTSGDDLAFQLAVPEPMTALLLVLGGVMLMRRRDQGNNTGY